MTLRVLFHDQLLFEAGTGETVLFPFDARERALVVQALASALAALSGSNPQSRAVGVEIETGPRHPRTARGSDECVVVPLPWQPLPPREV